MYNQRSMGSLRATRAVGHWSALVLHGRRIPLLLFTLGNECPARQRSFNTAGLLAKYRLCMHRHEDWILVGVIAAFSSQVDYHRVANQNLAEELAYLILQLSGNSGEGER